MTGKIHNAYIKTVSAIAFILAFSFVGAQIASAQATTTPPKRPLEIRKELKQQATTTRRTILQSGKNNAEAIRAEAKERRDEIKENTGTSSPLIRLQQLKVNRASTTEALKANRASTTSALRANREEFKKQLDAQKDALKKQLSAKKSEKKKKLAEDARERVEKRVSNIYQRLTKKITDLTQIESRLKMRIDTVAATGKDTTSVNALFVTAQTALQKAQVNVDATKGLLDEQVASSTSKESIKLLVTTAETSIKDTSESFKKVAEGIRTLVGTSTATSTQ
jgi:hypothetical protein